MNYVLTNEQMKRADAHTIKDLGVDALTLMERAGLALAKECLSLAPEGEIAILCGGGNNGGDGFVCARILLSNYNRRATVVCAAKKYSIDCETNARRWRDLGGAVCDALPEKEYALLVDCLYGTGFHGKLQGEDERLVTQANERKKSGAKILSADIPSGVNGKNGRVCGEAIRADVTLCIGELKMGVTLGDGLDYAGVCKRADIGIALPENGYALLLDKGVKDLLPARKRNSHKGSYGRAAIVAGSIDYTGAAYLSAAACLRSGVGYTTLYLPKEILSLYALKAPEILLKYTNEGGRYAFNEEKMAELLAYDAVAYGMGGGVSNEVYLGAKWLLENYEGKLLLDADGLNSLAAHGEGSAVALFARKKCDVILTPHVKEFSRLLGNSVEEILEDGPSLAVGFAKRGKGATLLKGATSIITDGERIALNVKGSSAQAKGGSGDVLSGVIVGLCAQGLSVYDAACLGAYLVGSAAEISARKVSAYAATATDIIQNLGEAFLGVAENADEYGRAE